MKTVVVMVLAAVASVVLQTTLMPYLSLGGTAPNLILLMVIFISLQRGTTLGMWMAFGLGLLQDGAGGGPLGLNASTLLGVAYLVGLMRTKLFKENIPAQVLIVVVLTFFHQFLVFYWMNTLLDASFLLGDWFRRSLIMSAYHAWLGPLLFHGLARWIPGDDVYQYLIPGRSRADRRASRRLM